MSIGVRDRVKTLPKVNRRALRKYGEFWRALQQVGDALAEAEKVAGKSTDAKNARTRNTRGVKGVSAKAGGQHWSVASPEEVSGSANKAHGSLQVMAVAAKRWEAELISREWRK
ncbi:hypothetical protein FRP1_07645 [Pseudonocardia sp. EC080625-04]|nr:hypothetical protein FRP1_07645 [Pseudonocardia sp. EC080625-04]